MKRRRGPLGPVAGIAQTIATAVRRDRGREPRAVLYDAGGHPQVLSPDAPGHAALVDTAERLVQIACAAPEPPPGRRAE